MYVHKEAVLSSQIEGTQASLDDVLGHKARAGSKKGNPDIEEVVNYVRAMNFGLERLRTLPLSNRLLRELHHELLQGVRGHDKTPGEFRTRQNWIGSSEGLIEDALFVPPPPAEAITAMNDLEVYLHSESPLPTLLQCALVHAQFETIHPFLDGNGRLGRLLITFMLYQQKVLQRPLLYLSVYLKQHRDEYYTRLQAIRDNGDWEEWITFFLKAVISTAEESATTIRKIIELRESHRALLLDYLGGSTVALSLLDQMFKSPYLTARTTAELLDVSYNTTNTLIADMVELELLTEITGQRRNRVFVYGPYLALMRPGTEL